MSEQQFQAEVMDELRQQKETMMQFERLHITKRYSGEITGSIEFSGEAGKIELTLNDASCKKCLLLLRNKW